MMRSFLQFIINEKSGEENIIRILAKALELLAFYQLELVMHSNVKVHRAFVDCIFLDIITI